MRSSRAGKSSSSRRALYTGLLLLFLISCFTLLTHVVPQPTTTSDEASPAHVHHQEPTPHVDSQLIKKMLNSKPSSKNNDKKKEKASSMVQLLEPNATIPWTTVPNTGGNLLKKILQPGTGAIPKDGTTLNVHYTGTLARDGTQFDSSYDRGKPFSFPLGAGRVIRGWDVGLATMHYGEKAILRCFPSYAYGARGFPPIIPGDATLDFVVELLAP